MGIEDEGLDVQEAIYRAYETGVKQEHERIVAFLDELLEQKSGINLYGAILLLKEKYGTPN
jgi:hypothetical protein